MGLKGVSERFPVFHVEHSAFSGFCDGTGTRSPTDDSVSSCGGMGSCRPTNKSCLDLKLNSGAGDSPFCSMHLVKSHEDALSLGGVPVLSLMSSKPSLSKDSERRFAAGRLSPPDSSTS